MDSVIVRRLGPADLAAVQAAAHLFDDPPDPDAALALLVSATDHLLIAYLDGQPAGFALAHELRRLDGPPDLMLYDIGTDEGCRRQGVARRLMEALLDLGRQRQVRSMFVLTHARNTAAMALYAATGGTADGEDAQGIVMFDFLL